VRRDLARLGGLLALAAAAVLVLSVVDAIPKDVLAPLATLLGGGIAAYAALRIEERRRKDEIERAAGEARGAAEREAKAARERARQAAVPLVDQFRTAAALLDGGHWPDPREIEVLSAREECDALVLRLGDNWGLVSLGIQTMREVADKSKRADSPQIDDLDDRLIAELDSKWLTKIAEVVDQETSDDA
jgi:hypothetical protein